VESPEKLAMKPSPQSLQRLGMIADVLRDRDLSKVALSARHLAEIDMKIAALDRSADAARAAAHSITDPAEYLRYQGYADLTGRRRVTLLREREDHAASMQAAMAEARHSFARATVLDTLEKAARESARRKRLG
jgi:hypothetical protein